MERDWDARAREAAEYYIASGRRDWERNEFFQGGWINVTNEITEDMHVIARGRKAKEMRVLEIGCGVGRMTRAMACLFAEVHAVDISAEMIALARRNLLDLRNVFLYKNNGTDLLELPDRRYDFAFSFIVFQHIPSLAIIETYIREVYRCLKPDTIFKFQVRGETNVRSNIEDTWVGVPVSLPDAHALAARCGFELIRAAGQGTQYFWLWFLKPKFPWIPRCLRRHTATALEALRRHTATALETLRDATNMCRFWLARPATVVFEPNRLHAGDWYRVRVESFAGQTIDVGYELKTAKLPTPVKGVVENWCSLDSRGEARILAPVEHPIGIIRITKVRSPAQDVRWSRAYGSIQVLAGK
jgi:ubiquinone/menaquinone biosynthesis C-methylase UbiE